MPRSVFAAILLGLAACDPGPVAWREAPGGESPAEVPAIVPATPPPGAGRCDSSVRVVRVAPARLVALWWAARGDSSVTLLSARSADDGRSWAPPVPVDTVDRGARGCERPAPGVAWDARSGYVHVVYFLEAPEGPGVFFSHSMDAGAMFHAPVPIVYGERPARASVAAEGDTVAVAYEDPNSQPPRIVLALSRSAGHIFEDKILPVSGSNAAAEAPVVSLRGRIVRVAWRERSAGRLVPAAREGTLR